MHLVAQVVKPSRRSRATAPTGATLSNVLVLGEQFLRPGALLRISIQELLHQVHTVFAPPVPSPTGLSIQLNPNYHVIIYIYIVSFL